MSPHTNDWLLEDLDSEEQHRRRKTLRIQKYLQNPFSITWSEMENFLQAVQPLNQPKVVEYPSEQSEIDHTSNQDLYPSFIDRVDPSLYYTIFFSHNQF